MREEKKPQTKKQNNSFKDLIKELEVINKRNNSPFDDVEFIYNCIKYHMKSIHLWFDCKSFADNNIMIFCKKTTGLEIMQYIKDEGGEYSLYILNRLNISTNDISIYIDKDIDSTHCCIGDYGCIVSCK